MQEVIGRLRERRLAVRLAAVAQHDPKDMAFSPLAFRRNNRRARAEIDLSLVAGSAFHPPKWQGTRAAEALNESPHAVVAEAVGVAAQVLMNPPGAQPLLDLGCNLLTKRLALAGRSSSSRPASRVPRAGRQVTGGFGHHARRGRLKFR